MADNQMAQSWHIPRPTLLKSDKGSDNGSWKHPESPSRGSTSSQSSNSSRSATSGTLLLTAANLANLAAIHPPTITKPKDFDTVSVASSTHFTVVNGMGRQPTYRKCWCSRNKLSVLVCMMSGVFLVGLIVSVSAMYRKGFFCDIY